MATVTIVPQHPTRTDVRDDTPTTRRARQRRTDAIARHLRAAEPASPAFRDLSRQLVEVNIGVALTIARRYNNRGIDVDDLEQVALLGLTKAAQRFDAAAGHDFLSFAVPTIRGELRRHFRDAGWTIRPPRRVQELQARIGRAREELEQSLHRSPRPSEIAQHLGAEPDAVIEALAADSYFTPTSLDATVADHGTALGQLIGHVDTAFDGVEAKIVVEPLIARLPARDRRIIELRFHDELTQQQIAAQVGLTQAQVSRILRRILADLKAHLVDRTPAA